MSENDRILCPSSRAKPGARLIGVRQDNGAVAILPQPLHIDEHFIEIANRSSPAEQKFRFTHKCVESGCTQWTGSRCGVADNVLALAEGMQLQEGIPSCGIRHQCRWYNQNGENACKVCPLVITETTEEEWLMTEESANSINSEAESPG